MWQCSAKIFYFFLCHFYLLILFVIHFLGHIFTFINKRICLDFILFQQGNIFYYFILFLCYYAFFTWYRPTHKRSIFHARTYVGGLHATVGQPPWVSIAKWNKHEEKVNRHPRTNNSSEGKHAFESSRVLLSSLYFSWRQRSQF